MTRRNENRAIPHWDAFCMACGRPGPTTEGMGPAALRERASEWFREAVRLEARATMLEQGKGA